MSRKPIIAGVIAVTLLVTAGTAFGLSRPHSASTSVGAAPSTTRPPGTADHAASRWRRPEGDRLETVLDALVSRGTITKAQEKAILDALRADHDNTHSDHPGRPPLFGRSFQQIEAALAKAIGITPEQLRQEMRSGKSIAAIAAAHGVSTDTVVTAAVDAVTAQIEQAVTDGKLSRQMATKLEGGLREHLTDLVNGRGFGFGGPGSGRPTMRGGDLPPRGPGQPNVPPASSTPPTTVPPAPAPSTSAAPATTLAAPSTTPSTTTS